MGPPLVNGGNLGVESTTTVTPGSFNGAAVSERRKLEPRDSGGAWNLALQWGRR